jgi:hypothetical protein
MAAYQACIVCSHKFLSEIIKGVVFSYFIQFINNSKTERDTISEKSFLAVACRVVNILLRKWKGTQMTACSTLLQVFTLTKECRTFLTPPLASVNSITVWRPPFILFYNRPAATCFSVDSHVDSARRHTNTVSGTVTECCRATHCFILIPMQKQKTFKTPVWQSGDVHCVLKDEPRDCDDKYVKNQATAYYWYPQVRLL